MSIAACEPNFSERRRTFWATQPAACGTGPEGDCATDCGRPGLLLTPASPFGRSIVTTNWVRGLALNILGTDAKLPNRACGFEAGQQGGHWSESYRTDGLPIGTSVRELPTMRSIKESISTVKAYLENDLGRLITMNIASRIDVTVEYVGGNRVSVSIDIISIAGVSAKVGLTGERSASSWVWN